MSGDSRRLCDNGIAIYPNETLQSRQSLQELEIGLFIPLILTYSLFKLPIQNVNVLHGTSP